MVLSYTHHTYIHTLLAPLAKVGGMRFSTRLSKVRIHRGPSPPEQFWCMYIHGGADRGDDILLAPHRAARQIHVEGRKGTLTMEPGWPAQIQRRHIYVCMQLLCMYAGRRMKMGPRRLEARRTRPSSWPFPGLPLSPSICLK